MLEQIATTEPAVLNLRDMLLALSLIIASASLWLHWHRGRKVVVCEWNDPVYEDYKLPNQPRRDGGVIVKLIVELRVNNETKHSIRIRHENWLGPRFRDDKIGIYPSGGSPANKIAPANDVTTFRFEHVPDWEAQHALYEEEQLAKSLPKNWFSKTFAEFKKPKRTSVSLVLTLRSSAFWFKTKKLRMHVEIRENRITHAARERTKAIHHANQR